MRRWIIVILIAAVLTGFIALLVLLRPTQASVKLADGSILTVQKIAFGKSEDLAAASWWDTLKQKIFEKLPRSWVSRYLPPVRAVGSRWSTSAMSFNPNVDGLQIYFNRRDAAGKFQEVRIYTGDIIDEHGCVFVISAASGSDNGRLPSGAGSSSEGTGSTITRLTFQEFPRQQKNFQLRLYDINRQFMGEVTVSNPLWPPKVRAKMIPQDFPISRQEGDVTYTLIGVKIVTNGPFRSAISSRDFGSRFRGPLAIDPQFEVRVHGQVVSNWTTADMDLFDNSGNVAPKLLPLQLFLCTNEPAWQLKVKFVGPLPANHDANVVMAVSNIVVPEPGQFVVLHQNGELNGAQVELFGLSGPGEVIYSNSTPVSASVIGDAPSSLGMRGTTTAGVSRTTVRSRSSVVALRFGTSSTDQWMTVVAYDERGRRFEAFPSGVGARGAAHPPSAISLPTLPKQTSQRPTFLDLDLPADAKTIKLVVAIEGSTTEEFIFKPPAGTAGK